jgi:hypothetical protein
VQIESLLDNSKEEYLTDKESIVYHNTDPSSFIVEQLTEEMLFREDIMSKVDDVEDLTVEDLIVVAKMGSVEDAEVKVRSRLIEYLTLDEIELPDIFNLGLYVNFDEDDTQESSLKVIAKISDEDEELYFVPPVIDDQEQFIICYGNLISSNEYTIPDLIGLESEDPQLALIEEYIKNVLRVYVKRFGNDDIDEINRYIFGDDTKRTVDEMITLIESITQ